MLTNKTRTTSIASLTTLLLAASMLTIPSAASDTLCHEVLPVHSEIDLVRIETEGIDEGTLDPGATAEVTAVWEYTAPEQSFSLEPVKVTLEAHSDHEWLEVAPGQVTSFVTPSLGELETYRVSHKTTVMLTEDAPAGETASIDYTASADGGTCVHPPSDMTATFTFTVAE